MADLPQPATPRPFLAIPAVDLREGRCVQLVGGRPEDERISRPDPVAVAAEWRGLGFARIHVVDLDAALGLGDNLAVIEAILAGAPGPVQVGGGVRDEGRVEALLALGVDAVIVGTRAVEDPVWFAGVAEAYPGRVAVAADVRQGEVLRRGWTEGTALRVEAFLDTLAPLPLAGILCTDVGKEGQMQGMDREGVTSVLGAAPHPVWISGGVTTDDDLAFLEAHGAAGAVLGMALYTETLNPAQVARRWGGEHAS
jgi:phosphoribosylformimino-5-aminoimidazole carboxamide ribotide isomerase